MIEIVKGSFEYCMGYEKDCDICCLLVSYTDLCHWIT